MPNRPFGRLAPGWNACAQIAMLSNTRTNWIILTAVVAVLGVIWVSANRVGAGRPEPGSTASAPEVGRLAPDLALHQLEGKELSLSDLRGQLVVLNFWVTWCPPCRTEIPALEQVWQERGDDVMVIGVNVQENPAVVEAFVADYGMSYPVVLDPEGEAARLYRVRAFPTTYFIDRQGRIARVFNGPLTEPLIYTYLTDLAGR